MAKAPRPFHFWKSMLAGHVEVGYLLFVVILLSFYLVGEISVLMNWPSEDVYLVPGVGKTGTARLTWGVEPPAIIERPKVVEVLNDEARLVEIPPEQLPTALHVEEVGDPSTAREDGNVETIEVRGRTIRVHKPLVRSPATAKATTADSQLSLPLTPINADKALDTTDMIDRRGRTIRVHKPLARTPSVNDRQMPSETQALPTQPTPRVEPDKAASHE